MMKRWWVLAVLVTLALSLTSCSKKMPLTDGNLNYGYQFCQGSMGTFDVYVIPSAADPSLFEVSIIPVTLDAQGDIAMINVANQASLSYKTITPQVVLNEGEEIAAGNLTANDLDTFNVIAITSFDATTNFLQSNSEKDAICQLPYPGQDGSGN